MMKKRKKMIIQAKMMVNFNKLWGLATLGVAHNRQAPRFAGTLWILDNWKTEFVEVTR
ncbi:MAG: hypothetical protein JRI49_06445 [Deltaproteobacteria bacterium]|nr:hypothetical protein [Deltaproteobacteria bacterium]